MCRWMSVPLLTQPTPSERAGWVSEETGSLVWLQGTGRRKGQMLAPTSCMKRAAACTGMAPQQQQPAMCVVVGNGACLR